jgi:tetratricopeptide (TPR) repeat protein
VAGNTGTTAVAWAALLLGLAALGFALAGRGETGGEWEEESDADLASAENLEGRLHDVERRLETLEGRVSELEPRLARAEDDALNARGEARRAMDLAGAGGAVSEGGEVRPHEGEAARSAEMERILADIALGEFGEDGAFPLMERARALGGLEEAMKAMEEYAAAHPTDPDALVSLGFAYSSKLLSVPDGPERGGWAVKALKAYDDALAVDADHWGAQFHRAFNLSQWPAFTNRQPEAIKGFETLIEKQERSSPEPKFAQTYLQLGNVYRAAGNPEKALEVLRRGLRIFPSDEDLRKQVEIMERK